MSEFNVADWIYGFSNVSVNISSDDGEFSLPISSIRIDLAANSVPMVKLVVDSSETNVGTADTEPVPDEESLLPQAPTLASISAVYKRLQALVNKTSVTASLYCTISCNNDTQQLNLEGWRVAGVGIPGASASGSYGVSMVLIHPAYDSNRAGCWVPNLANLVGTPTDLTDTVTNPVTGFVDACSVYLNKADDAIVDGAETAEEGEDGATPTLLTISQRLIAGSRDAVLAFANNLSWDNTGGYDIPLSGVEGLEEPISTVSGHFFWPVVGQPSMSIWDVFVGAVCPAFELTVNGDPSGNPLVVSPFCPWGKPLITIYDDEIADLTLPELDSDPISAVFGAYAGAASEQDWNMVTAATDVAGSDTGGSSVQEMNAAGGFLKPLELGFIGKVVTYNPPAWLGGFLDQRAATESGEDESSIAPDAYAENVAAGEEAAASVDAVDFQSYRKMAGLWCQQVFYRSYRYSMGVSMRTRLLISSPEYNDALPGGLLRTGITIAVKARGEGDGEDEVIFYLYITNINHIISSQDAQAYTTIQGAYIRSDAQIADSILSESQLTDGVPNPLYDSVGEISSTYPPTSASQASFLPEPSEE